MQKNIYSVFQVNGYIKNMFTQDFMLRTISVRGEASNVKYHSSGHIYFTLKDERSALSCVMFAGNRKGLAFLLEEGKQIVVNGTIDVYERDGKYQLYAKEITLDGTGQLYERFEALKQELLEMGMFAPEYKRHIPKYSKVIGVVTAPTGAAVRDIIHIATRRNPYVQILLYPAIVQGEQAVGSIINGIHALEEKQVDVMIVGRGGGSIEDLWAFNERAVAEAIFNCSVPIISAVGHETDTTIADFVADLRAPTPSAAAELAVMEYSQIQKEQQEYRERLKRQMERLLSLRRNRLENYQLRISYQNPANRIREQRMYALTIEEKLKRAMEDKIKDNRHRFSVYIERLKGLSPMDKLNQGYGFVADQRGAAIRDVSALSLGDPIYVSLRNGTVEARVEKITKRRK
ncbi:MAG: exodeoxyribonuclease VII large subunit [Roseburia sp.]|nr:exodeoxyribonuclease VII large subunit [Roseburia sp.]MCM1278461.1 exodeoxyribonuclease VII large subunit [Robinsoniella sp.]